MSRSWTACTKPLNCPSYSGGRQEHGVVSGMWRHLRVTMSIWLSHSSVAKEAWVFKVIHRLSDTQQKDYTRPAPHPIYRGCCFQSLSVVFTAEIAIGPEKLEAVTSWPRPSNITELRSLLGFCSYYQTFVEGFAKIAWPLSELLKAEEEKAMETPMCNKGLRKPNGLSNIIGWNRVSRHLTS